MTVDLFFLILLDKPTTVNPGVGIDFTNSFNLSDVIINRMDQRRALTVFICIPIRLMPGTIDIMLKVRNQLLSSFVSHIHSATLNSNTDPAAPSVAERIFIYTPISGVGRALRIASTTVIIDDVYVITGTAHLWRRGLTFDSSVAVSLFDKRLSEGRSNAINQFRRKLMANILGTTISSLPADLHDVIAGLREFRKNENIGLENVIDQPNPSLDDFTVNGWNCEGGMGVGGSLYEWLRSPRGPGSIERRMINPPSA